MGILDFPVLLSFIFAAVAVSVGWVSDIFAAFGLPWLVVVAGGAFLSLILRLFVRTFIGDRLSEAAYDKAHEKQTEYKNSYENYKSNRSRNEAYDKRYRAETGKRPRRN